MKLKIVYVSAPDEKSSHGSIGAGAKTSLT